MAARHPLDPGPGPLSVSEPEPDSAIAAGQRRQDRLRFLGRNWLVWSVSALLLFVGLFGGDGTARAAEAPPGSVGYRSVGEDIADMAALCTSSTPAQNLVLVVTVRGSGEAKRQGRLSESYFPPLAKALVERGYRVSGYEVAYPALDTKQLRGHIPEYLDSAVGSAQIIANQLQTLVRRCPSRQVVIGAYSQGGIALRAAVNRLRADVWKQFVQIDLFGDGSASPAVDRGMPVGRTPIVKTPARRATTGVWHYAHERTRASRSGLSRLFARVFRIGNLQAVGDLRLPAAYPKGLKPRVDRYCNFADPICDTKVAVQQFVGAAEEIGCTVNAIGVAACSTERGWFTSLLSFVTSQHSSYKWRSAALETAATFLDRTASTSIRGFDFLNRDYTIICPSGSPSGEATLIRLRDGTFGDENGYFPNLQKAIVAYGDGTGDGREDAAVYTDCSAGGSGSIPSSIVFELGPDGQPRQVGAPVAGRRPILANGVLETRLFIRQAGDPAGAPSLEQIDIWRFDGGTWTRLSSRSQPYSGPDV